MANVPGALSVGRISDRSRATGPAPSETRPAVARDETFVDIAAQELAAQIQNDVRSIAVVQHNLLHRFPASRSGDGRPYVLPDAARADDVSRTIGFCRRLAQNGQRPILVITESYLETQIGQIREKLCQLSLPVRLLIVADELPDDSRDGLPQHGRSESVLAFLRLLPETVIVAPKDGWELRQMLRFAAEHRSPVAVQIPQRRLPAIKFPDFIDEIDIGKAEILEEGDDLILLTFGPLAAPAVEAAERLSQQGLSVGVVNARFAQPLDAESILQLARRARGIVTVEEVGGHGGFGSAVLELLATRGITTPVVVTGAPAGSTAESDTGDTSRIVTHIVRAATMLMDHRGAPYPPAWGNTPPGLPAEERRAAQLHSRAPSFGISQATLVREQDLVQAKVLSPAVEAWVRTYGTVGDRSRYLWKWCLHGVELTILPSVLPELAAHVTDTKLLSIILCVVFDDVADQHGNGRLLQTMLHATRESCLSGMKDLSPREALVADVTWQLWRDYRGRTETYPYHSVFSELLQYDLAQFFNTMRYSQLLNAQLPLLNLAEHDLYTSHNMQMISFSTLDLMCSAKFDMQELGRLREAMWHAQCMGRIGNLLSTWRREIPDRDFTSGVFARAVSQGDLTIEQLRDGDPCWIEAAILEGEHELYFYRRWMHHRERLRTRARQIRSIDLTTTMDGHDRFFLMHLGSRGLI